MVFTELALAGAFLIEPERREDERGSFARTFCVEEFAAHGLNVAIAQCSVSYNRRRGTLRGLHYQAPPHGEDKLVRCTAGSAFDVVVDLRPGSVTFKRWCGVELSAANHRMLYVPAGFAHGFETLADDTELSYQMSKAQVPAAARILRWNDPAIGVAWPLPPAVMSAHDRAAGEAPESA
jgi:dTDP-4-dehydrorhamnose 3,5-epimerase